MLPSVIGSPGGCFLLGDSVVLSMKEKPSAGLG